MDCVIPTDVLQAARLSPDELKREVAVLLFESERLTLAQASRLAGLGRIQFQKVLASRGIGPNYGVEDLEEDLETLRRLEQA